ncbi:MAG: hypothetical protein K0R76_907, partial [Alphaproteobacteria bacterium]|nr:hypothetical protein [Alphaproteobacteria bacterium]
MAVFECRPDEAEEINLLRQKA